MKIPFLAAVGALLVTSVHAAEQPNIVLLLSDDQAWTDYGFMGHEHIETPHLDALAKRSAVFPRGYVPVGLCRPSLATIATGRYPHEHGITGNDPELDQFPKESPEYKDLLARLIAKIDTYPTLMDQLGEAGYLSHQSGKWWEGNFKRGGFTHGMTRGFPQKGGRHGDDGLKIGREGVEPIFDFVDMATEKEEPFFLWYAPFLPHTPHNPPARLMEKYQAKVDNMFVARYYAMCEWFDETCGEIIDGLEERGLSENTIIYYVGDNGWIQSEKSGKFALRSKQSPNEGGVRQPAMFSWPGTIEPKVYEDTLVSTLDFLPTVLAATKAKTPEGLPGVNLLPMLTGEEDSIDRERIFGESFAHDVADVDNPEASLLFRWVIEGDWKLLLTYDGKIGRYKTTHPRTEKRPQLFNLKEDPTEQKNLASEHPEKVADLAEKIAESWELKERKAITSWE